MDIITAAIIILSTGAGVLTSAVRSQKTTAIIRWRPQTQVELFLEQKELSQWLITEVAHMQSMPSVSKDQISEVLHQISLLQNSAHLFVISNRQINNCLTAADMAVQIAPQLDRRHVFLLGKLTEAVVSAVLRASGQKEGAINCQKTCKSLAGIALAFRSLSSGISDIQQWKNDPSNRKPNP